MMRSLIWLALSLGFVVPGQAMDAPSPACQAELEYLLLLWQSLQLLMLYWLC